MPLEHNQLETLRFGIAAAHVVQPSPTTASKDVAHARNSGVELLTVRIDANDLPTVHAYEALGFQLMDTLVYFGRKSVRGGGAEPPAGTTVRLAVPSDATAVADVAHAAFAGYAGHFHADPRLDNADADAAYVEWAETSIARVSTSRPALVCVDDADRGRVVGFLTLSSVGEPTAEIILNAVHPDLQGRRIYESLVVVALGYCQDEGSAHLSVSTQINNYRVQRVWSRLGFMHERSLYTLHKWFC